MIITIIRHGKVNHIWKKRCSSAEFDEECRLYDIAPIDNMARQTDYKADKVYISDLVRSRKTAQMLFGDMAFSETNLINEVPLKSAFDTELKVPLWFWNASGRLQWFCNSKRQPETRRQTRDRAELFAKELIKNGEDCTIVTHGFFMHTLIDVMKQHGFGPDKTGLCYQNGEAIILKKG